MKKNIVWNTIGSFTIALTSLFYTIILTRYSTLEETGLYTIAFALACNTIMLANFGGRTYQVTDTKGKISSFSYILSRYITVIGTILIMLIYVLMRDYSWYKMSIILLICLFKYLEEISDVYYGILQKNDQLYKVGEFQFLKSLINIVLFYLVIYYTESLLLAVIAIIMINLFSIILFERKAARKCEVWKYKFYKQELKKYFKDNLFVCLLMFLTNYIINAPKYAIDQYLSSDIQAIFGILIMPATVMLLVAGFIVNPLLVNIADKYNNHKYDELYKLIFKILGLVVVIGICGLGATYLVGIPVLNIIYGLNLNKYKTSLMIIVAGSIIYTITGILSTIFIAMREIKSQVICNIFICMVAWILTGHLVDSMGINGGAISYFCVMVLRLIIYLPLLFINMYKQKREVKIEEGEKNGK